jgi:hypothetical protein
LSSGGRIEARIANWSKGTQNMTRISIGCLLVILIALFSTPLTAQVGCRLNSDCPIGDMCTNGSCVAAPPCTGNDCPCTGDAVCGARELCNSATGRCVAAQCLNDLECALNYVCGRGQCVVDVDADRDRDGVPDAVDNCPVNVNPGQGDHDRDGTGDACDDDWDDDGEANENDNCPWASNQRQGDRDGDGTGDACEADWDNDGVPDDIDNCTNPLGGQEGQEANPDQRDSDGDGYGDACDPDWDNDAVSNLDDNCPLNANPKQWDRNGDGVGDACEPDIDYDGVPDDIDNCAISFLDSYNPDQIDSDGDGRGDPCQVLDRVRPPKRQRIEVPLNIPPLPSIQNILPRAAEEDDGDERRNVPLPPRDELLLPPVLRR